MKTILIISSSVRLCRAHFLHPGYRTTLLCRTLAIVMAVLAVFQATSAKAQDPEPMEPEELSLQAWCESGNGSWFNRRCTVSGTATLALGYSLKIERPETLIITSTGTLTNDGVISSHSQILNDGFMMLNANLLSEGEFENNGTLNIGRAMTNREQLINKGTINVFVGAKLNNLGTIRNYATINNNGRIVSTQGHVENVCQGKIIGNIVEGTVPVSVSCTSTLTSRLEEGFENGRIPANRANGLLALVNQIQALIDNDNQGAACHVLDGFIAQVNALSRTGAISARTAGGLLDEAALLKFLLGC